MPAAAVIPAPIAYIKVVAVKKLVVELVGVAMVQNVLVPFVTAILGWNLWSISLFFRGCSSFTVKKLKCSKQAYAVEYISME